VERAVVVGEEIAVAVEEEFGRSGDQEHRIHRTVVVVPGQKPEEYKRTVINTDNLVGREKREAEGVQ